MSKFIDAAQKRFGPCRAQSLLAVDYINHRDGRAICLLTFTNKKGVVKTISKKVFLNPETYPEALQMEGQTAVL